MGKNYDIILLCNNGVRKVIGIYKITNKLNGHIYIGLSKNIDERWKKHC